MSEINDILDEGITKELAKSIQPINKESVNKICSGQVVVSLATAVKELVENSLDAKSTLIEIKLKDHGFEQIEVIDNGSGVEKENFEGLTAKHHTSKIRVFNDLRCVETFGFRGEALSSLCTLSDLQVITRHSSVDVGTKLIYDHHGNIKSKIPCSRQIGTTVIITNLFTNLPVRRKDLQKNLKKEFIRMCFILQSYGLVSIGVRIVCTNQTSKGNRSIIMSTNGTLNVLDNITSIFSSKQTSDLMKIESHIREDKYNMDNLSILQDDNLKFIQEDIEKLNLSKYEFDGWISSCAHGCGRSAKDRQFVYINNRPCEPKRILKLINDVYHKYNSSQYPFVYLNIKLDQIELDINLTPDKRQILVNDETILVLALKLALLNTFGKVPSTYKLQNLQTKVSCIDTVKQNNENINDLISTQPNLKKFNAKLTEWKLTGTTTQNTNNIPVKNNKRKAENDLKCDKSKMQFIQSFLSQRFQSDYKPKEEEIEISQNELDIKNDSSSDSDKDIEDEIKNLEKSVIDNIDNSDPMIIPIPSQESNIFDDEIKSNEDSNQCLYDNTNYQENQKHIFNIDISIDEIKEQLSKEYELGLDYKKSKQIERLKFKTEINPNNNDKAEKELETEITKDDFHDMEIIGQFNLGFIITKLDNDLFIIDQHATDEKYNFEILQKTTKIQNQKLVIPQPLYLTSINELILKENLEMFSMNGFEFDIDESAEITKQIKLTSIPMSDNWKFGKEDIDELLFMLQDAPASTICRPTRVRAMFASRACRKSVMIGTALKKNLMKQLVNHMGEIEHPWNCPHGRPTMRHLINLALIED